MKAKTARELAKSLIVDLDGVLANAEPERHTSEASAIILAARLLGGISVNLARIADALEVISDVAEDIEDGLGRSGKEKEREPGDPS
jgi:hypothetical protein